MIVPLDMELANKKLFPRPKCFVEAEKNPKLRFSKSTQNANTYKFN